jgi:hypothetical protein
VLANNQIGFEVGTYEATRPLVIDPVVRAQVEGDGESSRAIAVDQQGQIYTTGRVGNKVFVEKRAADPDQTVLYSTSSADLENRWVLPSLSTVRAAPM